MTLRARGEVPSVEVLGPWRRLWQPFWALPLAICLGGILLGLALPEIDRHLSGQLPFLFQGGPEGARSMLATIASAMISVTGLVFSITMVVLQLASSQFTPRILGDFLATRIVQVTLGVFTAAFVYSLTVLRSVTGDSGAGARFVPQLSVTAAFGLVLASVGCFIAFIHHITTAIQVSRVISRLGDRTVDLVDHLFPEAADGLGRGEPTWSPKPGTPRATVTSGDRHGMVTQVAYERLVGIARSLDSVVAVDVTVGDFVTERMPLATIWGPVDVGEHDRDRVAHCIGLETNRSMRQDVAFGIRQLVDIAERALSPGINDPTTAVQTVNELHRILRVLVRRRSPGAYIRDDKVGRDGDGKDPLDPKGDPLVRVVHRPQQVGDLVRLATEEITHYGRDSVQVPKRLRAMIDDLRRVSDPVHVHALDEAARRLDDATAIAR